MIARGHVEAWQNGHVLRADEVTFNRQTGVATATGHVTLIEPSGQVLFADAAQLDQGMRDGILTAIRARLEQNGKLAANGGRRTGGVLNAMSQVVYSTCNLCKKHPERPPLWQIRASKRHRGRASTSGSNTPTPRCRCSASRWRISRISGPPSRRPSGTSGLLVPSFGSQLAYRRRFSPSRITG